MTRPDTPDLVHDDGTRTMTIKRACDGCHQEIGDATDQELDEAVAGLPLYSVAAEHGCGQPGTLPTRPVRNVILLEDSDVCELCHRPLSSRRELTTTADRALVHQTCLENAPGLLRSTFASRP